MENLAKTYNPKDFEERLYDFWMENDYFKAEIDEELIGRFFLST